MVSETLVAEMFLSGSGIFFAVSLLPLAYRSWTKGSYKELKITAFWTGFFLLMTAGGLFILGSKLGTFFTLITGLVWFVIALSPKENSMKKGD